MARAHRFDPDGGWHHVMNRGAGHRPTFLTRNDGLTFERYIGEAHERLGVEVHAYCLMNNHYHLLVHCPAGGLSAFMQFVSASYTRTFNERHGSDGPIFRSRFHSIVVDDPRYLLTVARYIHRNPLDLRPPRDLAGYRWSSHAVYVGRRATPAWLRTEAVLNLLAGGAAAFDELVQDGVGSDSVPSGHALDLIEMAAVEQAEPHLVISRRQSRTLALVLGANDSPIEQQVEEALSYRDRTTFERARRGAHLALTERPELAVLVDRVARRIA